MIIESLEQRSLMAYIGVAVEDNIAGGGLNNGSFGSTPSGGVEVNGVGFFVASDGMNGQELWRLTSDVTVELVEDSIPGGGIGAGAADATISGLTRVNNTLFFAADDGVNGLELWRVGAQGQAEMVMAGPSPTNRGINVAESSFPSDLININGLLYFVASDGESGRELWRVAESGFASLVEDQIPGEGIRAGVLGSQPKYLTNVAGQLYFVANDGINGAEVWRVNNSSIATMVEDGVAGGGIGANQYDAYAQGLTNIDGVLFFSASDGRNGVELWSAAPNSDAVMIEATGGTAGDGIASGFNSSYPSFVTKSGDAIYFRATDGNSGYELWRLRLSDGDVRMVEDSVPDGGIALGAASSYPSELADVGGTLYFRAGTASEGSELWRVGGANSLAEVVSRSGSTGIAPGSLSSSPSYLTNVSGRLYFSANDGTNGDELWTVGSPSSLAEIVTGGGSVLGLSDGPLGSDPRSLTNANGVLFFAATNTIAAGGVGRELWSIVDAATPPQLIEDGPDLDGGLNPSSRNSNPTSLAIINNRFFFAADDGINGTEIWSVTPGNSQASIVFNPSFANPSDPFVPGINRTSADSDPRDFFTSGGSTFFTAFDSRNGRELYLLTQTPSGPIATRVEDSVAGDGLNPGSQSSNARDFIDVGGTVVFTADINNQMGIWRASDATNATLLATRLPTGGIDQGPNRPRTTGLINIGGAIFFVGATAETGNELWRIDLNGNTQLVELAGTTGGIAAGALSSDPNQLTNVNGTLYFVARNPLVGQELWRVDNGTGNAVLVEDGVPGGGIYPDLESSSPTQLTSANGRLYFQANDGATGRELWTISDAGVAVLVEDSISGNGIHPTFGSYPSGFTNVSGTLYFQADDGVNGTELWRLTGPASAAMVEDAIPGGGINPGQARSNPRELTNVNGTLFFNANNGTAGFELWRVDENGFAAMIDANQPGQGIRPGSESSGPATLTAVGNQLYFQANDGTTGNELWRVDASLANSNAIRIEGPSAGGINPGIESSYPSDMVLAQGRVFFAATDDMRGRELWELNPATNSAAPVGNRSGAPELREGSRGSNPSHLFVSNGLLYFAGNSGPAFGNELLRVVDNTAPTITRTQPSVSGNVGTVLQNTGTWFDANNDEVTLTASIGNIVRNGDGSWIWTLTPTTVLNNVVVQVTATDIYGVSASTTFTISASAVVLNRQVFYNRSTSSVFGNGSNNPINSIDPTKVALLPGQQATTSHYTNYVHGLNGIVVDVAGLGGSTTVNDLSFATWDGRAGGSFTAFNEPATVTLFPTGGVSNSTRIKIEFNNGAVRNTWLRVTLAANANTQLSTPDVFFFGSAVGDLYTGNIGSPTIVRVNPTDTSVVRQNQSTGPNSVDITRIHDVNKDGRVNPTDVSITRQNAVAGAIALFVAPVSLTSESADAAFASLASLASWNSLEEENESR